MPNQTPTSTDTRYRHAGTTLLWCVLAGGLVAMLLCIEPPGDLAYEFWNPAGAARLLADLLVFYCSFVIPLFPLADSRSLRTLAARAAVVLFSGLAGLVMLSFLTDMDRSALGRVAGFSVLASVAMLTWSVALRGRAAVYYSAAFITCVGVPVVLFFFHELFGKGFGWLQFVSPFSARRMLAAGADSAWVSWIVFGALLVVGVVAHLVRRRRAAG